MHRYTYSIISRSSSINYQESSGKVEADSLDDAVNKLFKDEKFGDFESFSIKEDKGEE